MTWSEVNRVDIVNHRNVIAYAASHPIIETLDGDIEVQGPSVENGHMVDVNLWSRLR